jgi:hypothetical protein
MQSAHSITKIHVRYKTFQKTQRDVWESFCIIDFYCPKIKDSIKSGRLPPLEIDRIWGASSRTLDKNSTYGALSALTSKGNYRRTLLEAVLTFEDYMSDLISGVYLDYPMKLLSETNTDNDENKAGQQKIVKLILDSKDREEMIDRLVEEKVRGIFYGNPVDVFLKDRAKMEFGNYFKDHHNVDVKNFKKIVAARNLVAHNNGIIDRKYLREADASATLGRTIVIDRQFLKDSLYVLSILAAQATRLVIENIYKHVPGGTLGRGLKQFAKDADALKSLASLPAVGQKGTGTGGFVEEISAAPTKSNCANT